MRINFYHDRKKISKASIVCVFVILLTAILSQDVWAQSRPGQKKYLKRKNKSVSRYTGGSIRWTKEKRYLSLGASVNSLNYLGDLAPRSVRGSTDISFTRPGIGAHASYRVGPNLSLRTHLLYGRIQGDDFESASLSDEKGKYRHLRNLHFRNDIVELGFNATYDLISNYGSFLNRVPFTPYVMGGISVFYHNPKAMAPEFDRNGTRLPEGGQWIALRPLGTEGQFSPYYDVKPYSLIQPSIQIGAGIRKTLSKRLDMELEFVYRFLFTDYIDDVSGLYVDLGALDNELSRAMSDRSREPVHARSGVSRDLAFMEANFASPFTYNSLYSNETFEVYRGFGHEHRDNTRGFPGNDTFFQVSLRVNYISTGAFRRAKFR